MREWLGLPQSDECDGIKRTPMNSACLIINTSLHNVGLYSSSNPCNDCPFNLLTRLQPGVEEKLTIDTDVNILKVVKYSDNNNVTRDSIKNVYCETSASLGEYGVYRLDVGRCNIVTEVEPINTYLPLILLGLLLLTSFIFYASVKFIFKLKNIKCKQEEELNLNLRENSDGIRSLQFLRGALLILIIFITTGAGGYPFLNKNWVGLSMADCLFFVYAWSIGVNIPKNIDQELSENSRATVIGRIFKRGFCLLIIGTTIDSTINILASEIYYWCPIQRLGLAYISVATCYTGIFRKPDTKSEKLLHKSCGFLVSLYGLISVTLLSVQVILTHILISINCKKKSNLDAYLAETSACDNVHLITVNYILIGARRSLIDISSYSGFTTGVMGILSTIIVAMVGLKTGTIYLNTKSIRDKLKYWLVWASFYGFLGLTLAGVSSFVHFNLWPIASLFLIMATGLYSYSFAYIVTDVWMVKNSIITSTGVTSLAIFSFHLLFSRSLPFAVCKEFDNHLLYLLQNVWILFLWVCVGFVLLRNKVHFII